MELSQSTPVEIIQTILAESQISVNICPYFFYTKENEFLVSARVHIFDIWKSNTKDAEKFISSLQYYLWVKDRF